MSAAVAFVGAALVAMALWVAMAELFRAPALRRLNVHGRVVPIGGGIVVVLAVVVAVALEHLTAIALRQPGELVVPRVDAALLTTVLGFGLLGLLDDLLESGDAKGFRGHLRALAHGRLTTGAVKLFGGGLLALWVVPTRSEDALLWLLVDAAVVALGANVANLLDRAPGRVTKFSLIVGGVLIVGQIDRQPVVGLAVVLGAAAGTLAPDLRERVMLGDAGANVLGAAIAWTFVSVAGPTARVAALVVLVALNVASERISFSRVIAATPGLRGLDGLGRVRDAAPLEPPAPPE